MWYHEWPLLETRNFCCVWPCFGLLILYLQHVTVRHSKLQYKIYYFLLDLEISATYCNTDIFILFTVKIYFLFQTEFLFLRKVPLCQIPRFHQGLDHDDVRSSAVLLKNIKKNRHFLHFEKTCYFLRKSKNNSFLVYNTFTNTSTFKPINGIQK